VTTPEWVDWFNHRRIYECCGEMTPAEWGAKRCTTVTTELSNAPSSQPRKSLDTPRCHKAKLNRHLAVAVGWSAGRGRKFASPEGIAMTRLPNRCCGVGVHETGSIFYCNVCSVGLDVVSERATEGVGAIIQGIPDLHAAVVAQRRDHGQVLYP
jgi:hypothetical protein